MDEMNCFLSALAKAAAAVPDTDLQDVWLRRAASFAAPSRLVTSVRVGFATPCLGRFLHLMVALPLTQWTGMQNLGAASQGVIISSHDAEALEWLQVNMKTPLRLGTLKISLIDEQHFHASVWKNAARKLCSSSDAVIIWDASRILGDTLVPTLLRVAWTLQPPEDWSQDLITVRGIVSSGTYGTLVVVTCMFWLTGGYDQEFLPMGCQDTDLLKRLKVFGAMLFIESSSVVGMDLPSDAAGTHVGKDHKRETVRHVAPEVSHLRWGQMDEQNLQAMHQNLATGSYIRNTRSPMAQVTELPTLSLG